jgi:hypothetical protein
MDAQPCTTDFFQIEGTLYADSPSYVSRPADDYFFKCILSGEFCYVLTARQMGKSSLMSRTSQRLKQIKIATAIIDLTIMSTKAPQSQWYLGLIDQLKGQLNISIEIEGWWKGNNFIDPVLRFANFLHDIVLVEVKEERLVIFIDEIETMLRLDFKDDFFASIRAIYNARSYKPLFKRLSFVFLGVATPNDLIKDRNRTPFNIGRRIILQELSYHDAEPLRKGLSVVYSGQEELILSRIFYWTNGHPCLTQKLCQAVVDKNAQHWNESAVDEVVRDKFLSERSITDSSIEEIWRRLNKTPDTERKIILKLYDDVYNNGDIEEDDENDERLFWKNQIKLLGLVRIENGKLRVYNKIFETIFSRDWIQDQYDILNKNLEKIVAEAGSNTLEQTLPRVIDYYFIDGGTLGPRDPSYVTRPADHDLLQKVLEGAFCYLLTARQMGKSSLMIRTSRSLRERGIQTAMVDLTTVGTVSISEWYLGLLSRIKRELRLQIDVLRFWDERSYLSAPQRFVEFLHDGLLGEITDRVTIFIDEIDTTLNLNFRDDFFAAIRAIYNARADDPIYNRLTFVLLGVATPTDLMVDVQCTPFNIGSPILLQEFSYADAMPLLQGLEMYYPRQADRILQRIFYWTNGHPYLTQRLCLAAVDTPVQLWDDAKLDILVARYFFSDEARHEPNLVFVRDRIRATPAPEREDMLALYRQIYAGKVIADDRSQAQLYLKLFGLVRAEQAQLHVCNRIYRRVFDEAWINENQRSTPTGKLSVPRRNQWMYAAIVVAGLIIIAAVFWLSR